MGRASPTNNLYYGRERKKYDERIFASGNNDFNTKESKMSDMPIKEILIGLAALGLAAKEATPHIKKLFNKNMFDPIKIYELEKSIMKKQKLIAGDTCNNIKTKLSDCFDAVCKDHNLRIHFINAVECMLLEMRIKMYIEFEKNHFVERDNWDNFTHNQADNFYNDGVNEMFNRFPELPELDGLFQEIKIKADPEIRREIAGVFDEARQIYIDITGEIKKIKGGKNVCKSD